MKHGSTKRLILCALFCALIAIGAQITIPVPYGAFTLQLLFVLLAGFLLPARDGFLTMLAYLLLGLVGAPVYAGFSGGLSSLVSPTFGFVLGMASACPAVSWLFRRLRGRVRPFPAAVLSGLAGIAVTYLFGAVYGYFVMILVLNQAVSPWFVVWTFCLMYLPFDAAKLLFAAVASSALARRLPR